MRTVGAVVRASFEDANPVEPVGQSALEHISNYFKGRGQGSTIGGVHDYRAVFYTDIYDNIDLRYYFNEGRLKYDFIVRAGGDPSDIVISYDGVQVLTVDENTGDLLIETPVGNIREMRPFAFQEGPRGRVSIECAFQLSGVDAVVFRIGPYDASRTLVIDPEVAFSTYLGVATCT